MNRRKHKRIKNHSKKTEYSHIRFEDLLTEKVYDNIYGFIYLTKQEKALLSTPYLNRLHFIKQNALSNFIFPGATHTRFAHSIGVLHIAEKIIQKLKKINKIEIDSIDHQVIRLAALLHDIGHYPLSHTLEYSYIEYENEFLTDPPSESTVEVIKQPQDTNIKKQNFSTRPAEKINTEIPDSPLDSIEETYLFDKKVKKEKNLFEEINKKNLFDLLKDLSSDRNQLHHEEIAKKIICNTNFSTEVDEILSDISKIQTSKKNTPSKTIQAYRNLVGDIITGKVDYLENAILKNDEVQRQKYYILAQIIHSNLDADQMDYMSRDTVNTGIKTTIRIDFLIDNLDICYKDFGEEKTKLALCFKMKALQSLEQFLVSKYYWYSEILLYDKVHILNLIAKRLNILMLLAPQGKPYKNEYDENNLGKLIKDPDKFFFFNDNYFWNKLESLISSNDNSVSEIIKNLAKNLINKNIPKTLGIEEFEEIFPKDHYFVSYSSKLIDKSTASKTVKDKFYNETLNASKKKKKNYFPIILKRDIFAPKEEVSLKEETNKYLYDKNINILPCSKDTCNLISCKKIEHFAISIADLKYHFLSQFYSIKSHIPKEEENRRELNVIEYEIFNAIKNKEYEKLEEFYRRKKEIEKDLEPKKDSIEPKELYKFLIYDFTKVI